MVAEAPVLMSFVTRRAARQARLLRFDFGASRLVHKQPRGSASLLEVRRSSATASRAMRERPR